MSGNNGQRVIYWDACIYLAWLKREQTHGQDVLDGIDEALDLNDAEKVLVITSTLTLTEVLSATIIDDQEKLFRKTFNSQRHIIRDVDPPIAMKARDYRQSVKALGKVLTTPDAIHLATAQIFKADEVWTLDGGKRITNHKVFSN